RIAGSDFPKGTLRSPQDQGKPVMGGGPVHGGKVHFSQPIVKLLEPVPTQQSNGRNIQGAGKDQAHGDGTAVLSVKVLGVVPVDHGGYIGHKAIGQDQPLIQKRGKEHGFEDASGASVFGDDVHVLGMGFSGRGIAHIAQNLSAFDLQDQNG